MIDEKKCTGCGACYSVCPRKAITIVEDPLGFLYPKIDRSACINCNLCSRTCPNNRALESNSPSRAYIGYVKEDSLLMKSSSGGAYTAILNAFLSDKTGILYAASLDENFDLKHHRFDIKKDDISSTRKSKYIQSSLWTCYSDIKKDLESGYKVMIVGTPCQIAGVKSTLKKNYDNLLLVDLLCTGVCSPSFFKTHVKLLERKRQKNVISYDMRFKKKDVFDRWNVMETLIQYSDGSVEKNEFFLKMFRKLFGKHLFYRNSCYACPYKNVKRFSDITIGDWWGNEFPDYSAQGRGSSSILVNSEKGAVIANEMSQYMQLKEIAIEKVVQQQPALRTCLMGNNTPQLNKYDEKELVKYLYKCSIPTISEFSKSFLKKILPKRIARMFLHR